MIDKIKFMFSDLDLIFDWAASRNRDRLSGQGNLFDLINQSADSDVKSDLSLLLFAEDIIIKPLRVVA